MDEHATSELCTYVSEAVFIAEVYSFGLVHGLTGAERRFLSKDRSAVELCTRCQGST